MSGTQRPGSALARDRERDRERDRDCDRDCDCKRSTSST
jgi:hypothetical protein